MNNSDTNIHSRSALQTLTAKPAGSSHSHPQVEIVLPVYNEQRVLRANVMCLYRHMLENLDLDFQITIVDNASTDMTAAVAVRLARDLEPVRYMRLEQKGRGRALGAAWSVSEADVLCYMDIDLSTDLSALGELLEPLLDGEAAIAIGSRLIAGSEVTRGIKRELISRAYNVLLGVTLDARFSDAQCGFKAGRREVIQPLLERIEDERWFFDTELLHLAQQDGLRIHEVPVRWIDDQDSRVEILSTVWQDLRGIVRLRRDTRHRSPRLGSARRRPLASYVEGA
jgi:glycosyltransferase involved in cell wall biosynthesis